MKVLGYGENFVSTRGKNVCFTSKIPKTRGRKHHWFKVDFKNKCDEHWHVTRNKAWLVAQGYTQIGGVDFDETFGHDEHLLPQWVPE